MRPTGVVLIAVYHFLSALFLVFFAVALLVGGTLLATFFGKGDVGPFSMVGIGQAVAVVGGIFFFLFALVAVMAGYGMWAMREWGRILSIALAVIALIFSFPGLLMMGIHLHLFIGTYRLFRIAISILIIWYLVQPQIKALFQDRAPATPLAP
ncbi:MAG TPA: hypothetical protein VK976_14880 [Verrucomicrobiae bacterium]|jgi:hypothetical protein|nr:hypothetical protein [Verrucomicrobiae bacterium]